MSISSGLIDITVSGKQYTLKPSFNAYNSLNRLHGGMGKVLQGLFDRDLNVIASVIRYGAGLTDTEAKTLPERIYKTGLADLLAPCIELCGMLQNGGKPIEPATEGEAAPDAEGNG